MNTIIILSLLSIPPLSNPFAPASGGSGDVVPVVDVSDGKSDSSDGNSSKSGNGNSGKSGDRGVGDFGAALPPLFSGLPSGPAGPKREGADAAKVVAPVQKWRMADASGQVWEFHDSERLKTWVAARNSLLSNQACSNLSYGQLHYHADGRLYQSMSNPPSYYAAPQVYQTYQSGYYYPQMGYSYGFSYGNGACANGVCQ